MYRLGCAWIKHKCYTILYKGLEHLEFDIRGGPGTSPQHILRDDFIYYGGTDEILIKIE